MLPPREAHRHSHDGKLEKMRRGNFESAGVDGDERSKVEDEHLNIVSVDIPHKRPIPSITVMGEYS